MKINFTKPFRDVYEIFLHHSATDNPDHDTLDWIYDVHVNQNGWSDVGYHFFIDSEGGLHEGRDLERQPAAQSGHNKHTIAICLSGIGDSFSKKQLKTLKKLCKKINKEYSGKVKFKGHKEVNSTECPHFDYKALLRLDDLGYMKKSRASKIIKSLIGFAFSFGISKFK